jgi:hypothetical protein
MESCSTHKRLFANGYCHEMKLKYSYFFMVVIHALLVHADFGSSTARGPKFKILGELEPIGKVEVNIKMACS